MDEERYWLIGENDNGHFCDYVDREELERILEDPRGYAGIERFLSAAEYEAITENWPRGAAIIVRGTVVTPRSVTKQWVIENE